MNGTVVPTPSDNIAPTTIVTADNSWKTTAFTSTVIDIDNIGGSGIEKGYYQVIDFDGTEWLLLSQFTTIGYKRLLRFQPVSATRVRFKVTDARAPVQLAEIGFFKASNRE